jgi:hypothetical protein
MTEAWRSALADCRADFLACRRGLFHALFHFSEKCRDADDRLAEIHRLDPPFPSGERWAKAPYRETHEMAARPALVHRFFGDLAPLNEFKRLSAVAVSVLDSGAAPDTPGRNCESKHPADRWMWTVHSLAWTHSDRFPGFPGFPVAVERMTWFVMDHLPWPDGRMPRTFPYYSDQSQQVEIHTTEEERLVLNLPPEFFLSLFPEGVSVFQASAWTIDLILDNAETPRVSPRWDPKTRRLWFGDKLCRQIKRSDSKALEVLDRFQGADWRGTVGPYPEDKIKTIMESLNDNLKLISFVRVNSRIGWKPTP